MNRLVALALSGAVVVACVTVKKMLLPEANLWSPVPAEQVHVYFADDSLPPHQRVAILHAKGSPTWTSLLSGCRPPQVLP